MMPVPKCKGCSLPISVRYATTTGRCYWCHKEDPVDGVRLVGIITGMLYIPNVTGYPHTAEILEFKADASHSEAFSVVLIDALHAGAPELRPVAVVPIPSASQRQVTAGVQSVAEAIARSYGVPALDCLVFTRQVESQKRAKGRDARRANILGALSSTATVPTGPVVVIDDVSTTGFTIQEAVRALIEAGATCGVGAAVGRDVRLEELANVGVLRRVE